jgi:hypothetical protein
MPGEVREVIVVVEKAATADVPSARAEAPFAEMQAYLVDVPEVVDLRESIGAVKCLRVGRAAGCAGREMTNHSCQMRSLMMVFDEQNR